MSSTAEQQTAPDAQDLAVAEAISQCFADMADQDFVRLNFIDVATGPKPEQTDAIIEAFDLAQRLKSDAVDEEKDAKKEVLTLIKLFGHPAPGTTNSHSIEGAMHSALMTVATSTSLDEEKVAAFRELLSYNDLGTLTARVFASRVTHELVDGAEDAIRTTYMPKQLRKRVQRAFKECLKVSTSAPRLKVDMLAKEPKLPRKRAAKKAVQA